MRMRSAILIPLAGPRSGISHLLRAGPHKSPPMVRSVQLGPITDARYNPRWVRLGRGSEYRYLFIQFVSLDKIQRIVGTPRLSVCTKFLAKISLKALQSFAKSRLEKFVFFVQTDSRKGFFMG